MLIGTDVGSYMTNETKNFLISDLIPLNTVNPLGPPGATGPQGPQGLMGATGPAGSQGVANLTIGIQGIQGIQGLTGLTGSQGLIGIDGPIGVTGLQGPVGATGATSTVVGATGPASTVPGPTGQQGSVQGIVGLPGAQGIAGVNGPQGLNWQGTWSAAGVYVVDDTVEYLGSSYFCYNNVGPIGTDPSLDTAHWAILTMIGADGPTGPIGPTGLTGADGPTGAQGLPGATGPAGPPGIQGNTGAQGIQGPDGPQGPDGATGGPGATGAPGATGNTGPQGPTGLTGTNGNDGATGATGATGNTGADGAVGAAGPTGPVGPDSTSNIGRFYGGGWIAAEWFEGGSRRVLIMGEPLPNNPWTLPAYQTTLVPSPGASDRVFGVANTAAITTQAGVGAYAAYDCENSVAGGYTDWYLPSIWELNMVYNAAAQISRSRVASSFSPISISTPYWSSTEANSNNAFYHIFYSSGNIQFGSKFGSYNTIPVRVTSI
jgi:hypothetical protein